MSKHYEKAITVVSITFIIYLSTIQIAQGQVSPALCRQRCSNQLAFYQRFVRSQSFLDGLYAACTRRCPVDTTTTSTTSTTTPKPTTTTTTTTSTTTTPTTTTSTSTSTTSTTSSTTSTTTTTPTTTTTSTTTSTPIPRTPGCGFQTSDYYRIMSRYRVLGGQNAGECEYPWMVAITVESRLCGGSILDKRHILTAAHCMRDGKTKIVSQPWQVRVRVGSSTITRTQVYLVKRISIHPRYGDTNENYDLAILTLSSDLQYSACVAPICLPEILEDPKQSDYCMVAGWGLQDLSTSVSVNPSMQKVEVPIIDNDLCRVYYDALYGKGYISDLKMCAGDYDKGGVDSCQGDSGGPLMCQVQGRFVIHGIVSAGHKCGLARYPGIYTRVAHAQMMDFITKIMGTS